MGVIQSPTALKQRSEVDHSLQVRHGPLCRLHRARRDVYLNTNALPRPQLGCHEAPGTHSQEECWLVGPLGDVEGGDQRVGLRCRHCGQHCEPRERQPQVLGDTGHTRPLAESLWRAPLQPGSKDNPPRPPWQRRAWGWRP